MSLFAVSLVLFLIMDPFGNITTFLNLLKNVERQKRRWIILREMFFALLTMLAFYYIGDWLMNMLQLTTTTVHIASGAILFLIAIKILFPSINSLRIQFQNELGPNEEPFVVPMAIPLIAGPSLLATIILYSHLEESHPIMLAAIAIAWFSSSVILFFGPTVERIFTHNGLVACERLMGMVLVLVSIQRFLEGVHLFVASCKV